jgi:hypothetical protein
MTGQPALVEGIRPGLDVRGIDRGTPVADWVCACGHHERATGAAAVIRLTHQVRIGHCPHGAAT